MQVNNNFRLFCDQSREQLKQSTFCCVEVRCYSLTLCNRIDLHLKGDLLSQTVFSVGQNSITFAGFHLFEDH